MKKVLIIAYVFPPSYAIGGRRWSYFAKYLHRAGYEVFVISSDQAIDAEKKSPWLDAIKDLKQDNIIHISAKFPYHVENNNPRTILEKIRYRLSLNKSKRLFPIDSLYDRYVYFGRDAYKLSRQIIGQHKISNIIVTGDPYYLVYEIAQLKRIYRNNIKLMVDIRDPWTVRGKSHEGEKKEFIETKKQIEVLELTDIMFVPVVEMKRNLDEIFPVFTNKIKVLPHGYDSDIFKTKKNKGDFNNWYYAGTIFAGLESEYSILEKIINIIDVKLDIFSFNITQVQYDVMKNPNVKLQGLISQQDLFAFTENYGVTLFLTRFKDSFSTKFYEIIKKGDFVLYIGNSGSISEYIKTNKIGYAIEADKMNDINHEIINLKKAFDNFEEKSYLAESYSFYDLTKTIIREMV